MSPCSTLRSLMSKLTTPTVFPRSLFKRPAKLPTAKSLEVFAQFPLEIFLLIFEKLAQDDLCSLSLSCHAMEDYLGPIRDRWSQCSRREKQEFLIRYVRDHREILPCFSCMSLHRPDQLQQPGVIKGDPETSSAISHGPSLPLIRSIPGYHFDFISLQMVMRAVRENKSTRAVNKLRAVFLSDETTNRLWPHKGLISIEARVINGSLYMRVQQWIYVISRSDLALCKLNAKGNPSWNRPQLEKCIHWHSEDPMWSWHCQHKDDIPELLSRHTERDVSIKTCQTCGISTQEIVISVGHDGGQAYILTHWIKLGTGESLDRKDQVWFPSREARPSNESLIYTGRGGYYDKPDVDICHGMYEAHGTFTWTALTRRNQSLITDRIHSL